MIFRVGDCRFELYFSKTKHWRVRVAEPDDSPHWDYGDCEHASDMSADLRECRSFEEASEVLFGC